ncbi:MAG TPA: choice-of-anchor tandem repeat GloVer-containing protein, partial [Acetobacteraceae bacterium]|nr:choice-of-anchor tandem repeat GloVer-containing protein [Acetobacteraceae bacterium]
DGAEPFAGLTKVGDTLYGTTQGGGVPSKGAVFAIKLATGTETAMYAFQGGSDGANPVAGVINVGGMLYGTTALGGGTGCGGAGCGTVFALDPTTGAETVVYAFPNRRSGAAPGELISVGNTLYGTTHAGGLGNCTTYDTIGCGTAFEVNPATGKAKMLYSFAGGSDGADPAGALINVGGTLYGATNAGGDAASCESQVGCGTIFAITP